MAIEDAVVLARRMRGDGDLAHKLASFVAERSPRTSAITRESWRFGRLGQWEGRLPCWLRDRLFGLLLPIVEPPGLLSYATFDVGALPDGGRRGAGLRDD